MAMTERELASRRVNLSEAEQWASLVGGGALTVIGLTRGGWGRAALLVAGAGLIWRGATGHCEVYDAFKISTARVRQGDPSVHHGDGIKVEKSVTVNKPAEELYRFWRNFENLPRFMNHLESVRVTGEKTSHWVAKAPAGMAAEWDAEIINEHENELISWRSLEGSEVPNAGSVRFEKAPNGRGTVVKVAINYEPPAGKLGALVAKLFGEEPEQQVMEDLRHFKQVMEAGELPSTEGQSSGRTARA
jgi:uncharacterized membrane protein